jgi:hypothetical protein
MSTGQLDIDNLGPVVPGSLIRVTVADVDADHLPMLERLRFEIEDRSGHDQFTVVVVGPEAEIEHVPPPSTTRSDT